MGSGQVDQVQMNELLSRLTLEDGEFGFMSCAVYDTAWVSMVAKPTGQGKKIWLFPECFKYVLDTQQTDGSWPSYAAPVDGILNTAASLLALKAHQAHPYQMTEYSSDLLQARATSAAKALAKLLHVWDIESCDHVGFEILVPRMLSLLDKEGYSFDFPGRNALMELNQLKLARFDPAYLYTPAKLTAVHSLEAFIGQIDFDRVRHHKTNGGYMGSPSSTAACLAHASAWDEESEAFLRRVFLAGSGRGTGGMPSAFPSTYFELTWVMSTLLEGGLTVHDIGHERAARIVTFLRAAMDQHGGRLGFAQGMEVDVDDTAKALLTLSLLGQPAPHVGLLKTFEGETHFKTYQHERNPSLSANCNVLMALLHQPEVATLTPQIIKAASFIRKAWWNGALYDKWNTSEFYPMMLIAEAFSTLLRVWDQDKLVALPLTFITDALLVTLYQVVSRLLVSQNADGSWGPEYSGEVTAYAILALWKASIVPGARGLAEQIHRALRNGREFLRNASTGTGPAAHLWIEKVTYRSVALQEAYMLAAVKVSSPEESLPTLSNRGLSLSPIETANVHQLGLDCFGTPLFEPTEAWKLQAAYMESRLFRPYLQRLIDEVVPGKFEDDPALEIIPFIWTACNYAAPRPCSTTQLRQKIGGHLIQSLLEQSRYQAALKLELPDIQAQTMEALIRAKERGLLTPVVRSTVNLA